MKAIAWLCVSLFCLAVSASALAQVPGFSIGAVAGARLSAGAPASYDDESRLYTAGPAFEVSFSKHLSVEINALYKRLGSSNVVAVTSPFSGPTGWLIASRTRAHSLELPILGKYYFGHPDAVYRIFAATGYAFQRSWTSSSSVAIALEGATGNVGVHPVGGVQTPTVVGAVFGAGAARKLGPLVISPTLRYTRWGARFDGASRNQTDFLLAVWF